MPTEPEITAADAPSDQTLQSKDGRLRRTSTLKEVQEYFEATYAPERFTACNVCGKTYHDTLSTCPHCEEAAREQDWLETAVPTLVHNAIRRLYGYKGDFEVNSKVNGVIAEALKQGKGGLYLYSDIEQYGFVENAVMCVLRGVYTDLYRINRRENTHYFDDPESRVIFRPPDFWGRGFKTWETLEKGINSYFLIIYEVGDGYQKNEWTMLANLLRARQGKLTILTSWLSPAQIARAAKEQRGENDGLTIFANMILPKLTQIKVCP